MSERQRPPCPGDDPPTRGDSCGLLRRGIDLLRGSPRRPCRCRQIPAEDRRFWRRQQGV